MNFWIFLQSLLNWLTSAALPAAGSRLAPAVPIVGWLNKHHFERAWVARPPLGNCGRHLARWRAKVLCGLGLDGLAVRLRAWRFVSSYLFSDDRAIDPGWRSGPALERVCRI